jgi:hypothetical protein
MKKFSVSLTLLAALAGALVLGLAIVGCATGGTATGSGVEQPRLTWTEVRPLGVPNNPDANNIFYHVAYGGGKFLVTRNNENRMMYSSDGITWTEVPNSPNLHQYGRGVIAYGAGKFIAARNQAYSSADGVTWTLFDSIPVGSPNSIVYGNGKFVAGGDWWRIAHSTDGITWTREDSPMGVHRAIAYGGGKFVAVGNRQNGDTGDWINTARMAYSTDGAVWTEIEQQEIIFKETSVADIAYGGGKFVAVGGNGTMAYSADGVTWTAIEQDILINIADDSPKAIAYGGGKFVAVGGWEGKMAYSVDGIAWTELEDRPTSNRGIYDIAYGGGRFVIVLGEDKIAYSNLQE